jgi:hypothetical protein
MLEAVSIENSPKPPCSIAEKRSKPYAMSTHGSVSGAERRSKLTFHTSTDRRVPFLSRFHALEILRLAFSMDPPPESAYEVYAEQRLVPALRHGVVIIMIDLSSH